MQHEVTIDYSSTIFQEVKVMEGHFMGTSRNGSTVLVEEEYDSSFQLTWHSYLLAPESNKPNQKSKCSAILGAAWCGRSLRQAA